MVQKSFILMLMGVDGRIFTFQRKLVFIIRTYMYVAHLWYFFLLFLAETKGLNKLMKGSSRLRLHGHIYPSADLKIDVMALFGVI